MSPAPTDYAAEVRRKAERLQRARKKRATLFHHLLQVGALGWILILPLLGGVAIGHLVARLSGFWAATLLGLLLGLAAGALGVFLQVRRSLTDDGDETAGPGCPGGGL